MELKSNLPSAAEETAENLLTKKYNVTDKNQLEAEFFRNTCGYTGFRFRYPVKNKCCRYREAAFISKRERRI